MFLPDVIERIELVEVLALDGTDDDGRLTAIWDADDARDALAMVAGLPDGEIKRCFIPGWQIRAHSGTGVLFEIAFCFRCDGALLGGPAHRNTCPSGWSRQPALGQACSRLVVAAVRCMTGGGVVR